MRKRDDRDLREEPAGGFQIPPSRNPVEEEVESFGPTLSNGIAESHGRFIFSVLKVLHTDTKVAAPVFSPINSE